MLSRVLCILQQRQEHLRAFTFSLQERKLAPFAGAVARSQVPWSPSCIAQDAANLGEESAGNGLVPKCRKLGLLTGLVNTLLGASSGVWRGKLYCWMEGTRESLAELHHAREGGLSEEV